MRWGQLRIDWQTFLAPLLPIGEIAATPDRVSALAASGEIILAEIDRRCKRPFGRDNAGAGPILRDQLGPGGYEKVWARMPLGAKAD